MTLIEKLELALAKHKRQDNVRWSLAQLREYGRATTGESTRRGAKVWTDKVEAILDEYGIPYESGNDAPRGGKNGEYVKLTSPTMLAIIRKERKAAQEEYERKEAERKAKFDNQPQLCADILAGKYDSVINANKFIDKYNQRGKVFRQYAKTYAKRLNTVSTVELRETLIRRSAKLLGYNFAFADIYAGGAPRIWGNFFVTLEEAEEAKLQLQLRNTCIIVL